MLLWEEPKSQEWDGGVKSGPRSEEWAGVPPPPTPAFRVTGLVRERGEKGDSSAGFERGRRK